MKKLVMAIAAAAVIVSVTVSVSGREAVSHDAGDREAVSHDAGSAVSGSVNYEWWYGCSPTSAGMAVGYYDRNGYGGLVPGGLAEINTFGNPSALVNGIIASPGHISDFYPGGYGASGDDLAPPFHAFDSLADFMGTSQDSVGSSNGSTTWWYWNDNSPLDESDIYAMGPSYYNDSGMYGIGEYLEYAGYDAGILYNQFIFGYGSIQAGFTLDQYQAEIDAGRPVLIHVTDHTMLGYGYTDGANTIQVYDTWGPNGQNPGTMTWAGSYPYGGGFLDHFGVTALTPIPEPATLALLLIAGLALMRRRP